MTGKKKPFAPSEAADEILPFVRAGVMKAPLAALDSLTKQRALAVVAQMFNKATDFEAALLRRALCDRV